MTVEKAYLDSGNSRMVLPDGRVVVNLSQQILWAYATRDDFTRPSRKTARASIRRWWGQLPYHEKLAYADRPRWLTVQN